MATRQSIGRHDSLRRERSELRGNDRYGDNRHLLPPRLCHAGPGRQDVPSVGFHEDLRPALGAPAGSRHPPHPRLLDLLAAHAAAMGDAPLPWQERAQDGEDRTMAVQDQLSHRSCHRAFRYLHSYRSLDALRPEERHDAQHVLRACHHRCGPGAAVAYGHLL